jgi:hypothetical protein
MRKSMSKSRTRRKQRGGLGNAYRYPNDAVVVSGGTYDDPEAPVPVLSFYGDMREEKLGISQEIEPEQEQEPSEKLNQPSPINNSTYTEEENAESPGGQEVQVEQAFSGNQSGSSRGRRRSTGRKGSKGSR